jgi:hypothetical protein
LIAHKMRSQFARNRLNSSTKAVYFAKGARR